MSRDTELEKLVDDKNKLFYIVTSPAWGKVHEIYKEHLARYDKVSKNGKNTDERRLRAIEQINALKGFFDDIQNRLNEGESAEKELREPLNSRFKFLSEK
ncbi:MAG: hypothetical protein V1850_06805 [Candidatus Bathyarchaeota archaeon]